VNNDTECDLFVGIGRLSADNPELNEFLAIFRRGDARYHINRDNLQNRLRQLISQGRPHDQTDKAIEELDSQECQ
jgi:hypothetical protein